MSGRAAAAMILGKMFLPGTAVATGAATTTTGFGASYIIFDRTVAVTNGIFVYSLGGFFLNAIASMNYLLALENSTTSMTIVAEVAKAHPGGNVWDDAKLLFPFLVPASGTYRLGLWATLGTDNFNNTGTRTQKTPQASDPGLNTVTGLSNQTDGTINLRYTPGT